MGLRNFFFGKKYRIPSTPRPRWMQVLIVLFVVYAALKSSVESTPENPNPINEAISKAGQAVSKPELEHTLGVYKNIIFPRYASSMDIEDITPGSGPQVVCGQQVKITYETALLGGDKLPFHATREQPLSFIVGDGQVIPALEQGVLTMRSGGKRKLSAAPDMSYGIKRFAQKDVRIPPEGRVLLGVELLSAEPAVPALEGSLYRIATLPSGRTSGAVLCGEEVKLKLTIWDMQGNTLYNSAKDAKPTSFTLGKSPLFYGLSQGIIGMPRGGKRLLVVPPEFQRPLQDAAPALQISFPEKQTVLVEVEALP